MPAPVVNGGGDRPRKVQFSELQKPVTLTLDRVIRHTVVHRSLTSIYIPNFIEIGQTFCARMDVRTYWRTFQTPLMLLGQLRGVDLIKDNLLTLEHLTYNNPLVILNIHSAWLVICTCTSALSDIYPSRIHVWYWRLLFSLIIQVASFSDLLTLSAVLIQHSFLNFFNY